MCRSTSNAAARRFLALLPDILFISPIANVAKPSAPVLPERLFSLGPDLGDPVHGLDRRGNEFSIISDGDIASFLEFVRRVLGSTFGFTDTHDDHFLSVCSSKGFCPSNLSRVSLHLEVFVALGGTESETFRIVSHKHGTMTWVDIDRAKVTLFDTHGEVWERAWSKE